MSAQLDEKSHPTRTQERQQFDTPDAELAYTAKRLAQCASAAQLSSPAGREKFARDVEALLDDHRHVLISDLQMPPQAVAIAAEAIARRYNGSGPTPQCRDIRLEMKLDGAREDTGYDWQSMMPWEDSGTKPSTIHTETLKAAEHLCSIAEKVDLELAVHAKYRSNDLNKIGGETLNKLSPLLKQLGASGGTLRLFNVADSGEGASPFAKLCAQSGIQRLAFKGLAPALLCEFEKTPPKHLVVSEEDLADSIRGRSQLLEAWKTVRNLDSLEVECSPGLGSAKLAEMLKKAPASEPANWKSLIVKATREPGYAFDHSDAANVIALLRSGGLPSLKSLSLPGCLLTKSDSATLADLLKQRPQITSLSLSRTQGLEAGHLLSLLRHSQVHSFNLEKAELCWPESVDDRDALARGIRRAAPGVNMRGFRSMIGRLELANKTLDASGSADLPKLLSDGRIQVLKMDQSLKGVQAKDVFNLWETGRLTKLHVDAPLQWPEEEGERNRLANWADQLQRDGAVSGWAFLPANIPGFGWVEFEVPRSMWNSGEPFGASRP